MSKILIIDDEEVVIKSCLRVLKDKGYAIDSAHSGEEGLEMLEENSYDLVITDLKMPGIGGLEVLKKIKERNPTQEVIVFTGYSNVSTARESLKSGAFDYIPKPFTPEELKDVVANALKAVADKGQTKMLDLMAVVAHEFKSPVAAMHTTANTLFGGYFGKLSPEQQKGLETIMRNCQYLEDIIRCFIDYSRVELDGLESFRREIDFINDVVKPVIEQPEYQSNLKGMPIQVQLSEVPPLMGDPDLLKIVINNLVNNAIKYGTAATPIEIKVYAETGGVVFSIRNDGVGIAQEDINTRLFQRFVRLKQKGSEGVKGSGLGLYLCRSIIAKHGGRIQVDSELGKYARFEVHLKTGP